MRFKRASLIACIALCLTVGRVGNAATVFTDRTAWETALGGPFATETFSNPIAGADSITLDNGIDSTANPSLLLSGLNRVDGGVYTGRVGTLANNHPTITWQFPGPIVGFFGDFGDVAAPNGLAVQGDFDGTGLFTLSIASAISGSGGFGIIGAASFSSLTWGTGNTSEFFTIDNFSSAAGNVSEVPLPAALPLFLAALSALGLFGWRRRPIA